MAKQRRLADPYPTHGSEGCSQSNCITVYVVEQLKPQETTRQTGSVLAKLAGKSSFNDYREALSAGNCKAFGKEKSDPENSLCNDFKSHSAAPQSF